MSKPNALRTNQCNSFGQGATSFAAWILGLVVLAQGCSNDGLESVTGVVSYDGKPVTKGNIRFIPERGRPASGSIDSNGRYTMATSKDKMGVAPGEYTVTIRVAETSVSGDDYATSKTGTTWIVPEKYADPETTPLRATVSSSGSNKFDFDISVE